MRVAAIIQARLGSTRLPGKVLMRVGRRRMLGRVIHAAKRATRVDEVIVAWAERYPFLEPSDVLGRFRQALKGTTANVIVRLTSDCPLIEPWVIDDAIAKFFEINWKYDAPYFCNRDLGALDGFDVQVCTRAYLEDPQFEPLLDREHVFKPRIKLSVDTPEDLRNVRALCKP